MSGWIERAAAYWALAGALGLLATMAATSYNAAAFTVDRVGQAFGTRIAALPGYEDFVALAIGCAVMMALPYCEVRKGHIAVDLIPSRAPRWLRPLLTACWQGVTVLLALFLAVFMARGLLEARADGLVSPVLGWPVWPFYVPCVLSLALWAVAALSPRPLGPPIDGAP